MCLIYLTIIAIGYNIFGIGIYSMFNYARRNLLVLLIAIELVILGLSLISVCLGYYNLNTLGTINALILLTLGGAESALGLAIIMEIFRGCNHIDIDRITHLKN